MSFWHVKKEWFSICHCLRLYVEVNLNPCSHMFNKSITNCKLFSIMTNFSRKMVTIYTIIFNLKTCFDPPFPVVTFTLTFTFMCEPRPYSTVHSTVGYCLSLNILPEREQVTWMLVRSIFFYRTHKAFLNLYFEFFYIKDLYFYRTLYKHVNDKSHPFWDICFSVVGQLIIVNVTINMIYE